MINPEELREFFTEICKNNPFVLTFVDSENKTKNSISIYKNGKVEQTNPDDKCIVHINNGIHTVCEYLLEEHRKLYNSKL